MSFDRFATTMQQLCSHRDVHCTAMVSYGEQRGERVPVPGGLPWPQGKKCKFVQKCQESKPWL